MTDKPKVLIWNSYKLEPKGGPAGYLFNIYDYVKEEGIENIDFLNNYDNSSKKNEIILFIKKIIKKISADSYKSNIIYKKHKLNLWIEKLLKSQKLDIDINLNEYDFIHFHSTWELFKYRKLLIDYNGIVLLTSHSPKVFHKEITEDAYDLSFNKVEKEKRIILENIDVYSFTRADYVIFPCEFSEEPYKNSWDDYANIVNQKKIKYLPTSIKKVAGKHKKDYIRNKYGINEDDILISYVGRHNFVKGYDLIKKFAKKIWEENKENDIYFIIAGKESPLKGLKDKRWIEIGWTNDPHSIIEASDLFILPNRETYFDLILLEVLSLGKPVLLSETGGNRYFKKFSERDLYYFEKESIDDMVNEFNCFLKKKNDNNININERIFDNNFTLDIFIKKYLCLLRELEG